MTIENFNKFYDEYQRFSAYVAYCITKDKLLAEDISQEIFITLYKMRENLDYSDHKKLKALVFAQLQTDATIISENPPPNRKCVHSTKRVWKRLPTKVEIRNHGFCAWKKKLIRDLFFGNSE